MGHFLPVPQKKKTCEYCGKPFFRLNQHITMRQYNEKELLRFRKARGIKVLAIEILHLPI